MLKTNIYEVRIGNEAHFPNVVERHHNDFN